jgi:hypothetical protein
VSAEIIEFTARGPSPAAAVARPEFAGTLTDTATNLSLRAERRMAWRAAEARTNYWLRLLRFTDAVSIARNHGLAEARAHPKTTNESRWSILDSYRKALGAQILTAAPDLATANWKRHELRRPSVTSIPVEKELIEKAIADDIAFLESHPVRKARANKA